MCGRALTKEEEDRIKSIEEDVDKDPRYQALIKRMEEHYKREMEALRGK
jgi:hypothetical protein